MKLSITVLAAVLGVSSAAKRKKVAAPKRDISATSKVGLKILAGARRLENDDANAAIDYTWVADMSLKFQGCYHDQVWNAEANGDEDVRISTQRLIRFRLCPSAYCTIESAAGCTEGYGDYIIDMETYLQAYFQAVQQDQEYNCDYEKEYGDCICNGENADDGFDEEICEYDCFMAKGMEYCVDKNPYQQEGEEEEEEEWDMERMAECQQYEFNNNNNNNDNNNNNNNNNNNANQVAYYVGAYCSENGGSIYLGLFTDDTCTQFADSYGGRETYATLSYGKSLPYSDSTMIGTECMSCKEPQDANQNNENDQADEDQVKESCEQLYQAAGKCESGLSITYPNNYACNYMQGIKIVRKSGAVLKGSDTKNKTASVFIGLFACSFVLLGGYVYYLKTKLDRAKINLSE